MNSKLTTKPAILGRTGSVWIDQSSKSDLYGLPLIRSVVRLSDIGNSDLRGEEAVAYLVGAQAWRYNFSIKFKHADVVSIPASTPTVYIDSSGNIKELLEDTAVTPFDWATSSDIPHFIIKIPEGIYPNTIASEYGELTSGISFTCGNQYIRLHTSPFRAFSDRLIFIRSAMVKNRNIHDYTIQIDNVYSDCKYISRYLRSNNSLRALELALNEVAGRAILPVDGVLTEIREIEHNATTVYVFDNNITLFVDYAHTRLELGVFYNKDTIVGQVIFTSTPNLSGVEAWVNDTFPDAFHVDLQSINPNFPDVAIPNAEVRFWAATETIL